MRARIIPFLLLHSGRLVKTLRFADPTYVGDPINAVKIFNEKEVDELSLVDYSATSRGGPDFDLLERVASEAFMPLSYGGGIQSISDAKQLFRLGFEKIILQRVAFSDIDIVREIVDFFGAQSVVMALDFARNQSGQFTLRDEISFPGNRSVDGVFDFFSGVDFGEFIITSVDQEGTRSGLDLELLLACRQRVASPLVLNGGAKNLADISNAVRSGADAVGAGALFTFFGPYRSVMINYPSQEELRFAFQEPSSS